MNKYVYRGGVWEHVLIAEAALGKSLPKGAQVHHVDGDKANNSNDNLVICPSQAYHYLLHSRQEALDNCGNPDWRKCSHCGAWDDPSGMYAFYRAGRTVMTAVHKTCSSERKRAHYRQAKLAA